MRLVLILSKELVFYVKVCEDRYTRHAFTANWYIKWAESVQLVNVFKSTVENTGFYVNF